MSESRKLKEPCPVCKKSFKRGGLRLHRLQKHQKRTGTVLVTGKNSSKCPVCHKVLKPGGVRLHILQKHSQAKPQ